MGAVDREQGPLSWTFDGERITTDDGRVLVEGPLMNANWAAVTDSESRKIAWLPVPDTEGAPPEMVEAGRRWVREGTIIGPGAEVSETLAEKQLIMYEWEAVKQGESSLKVRYRANLIDHVVFASFSHFRILLPLSPYVGAKATVDETHGGVILERFHGGPTHPSYWEGPARSIRLEADDLTLEIELSEGGFTWTSLVDGRAIAARDSFLVLQLCPSIAGPREKLGTLAWRGTDYTASFTINILPPRTEPPKPTIRQEAAVLRPPVALPPAVTQAFDTSAWELKPFSDPVSEDRSAPITLGNEALWCDLPLRGASAEWGLEVGGRGEPRPAFLYLKGPVEDFYLKINGMGDFRDPWDLLDQLDPLPVSPRDRAEEIWRYAAGVTYPMPLHPTDDLGEFLGSYGYGFSSTLSAMALVGLWECAGFPARRAFVANPKGHATLGEVYYDGDWHAYDLHRRTFYVDPSDWSPASAEELSQRPDLVRFNRDAGGRSPSGAIADDLVASSYEGAEVSYNPGSFSFQRLLRTSLAEGETLVRFYRGLNRWAPSPREPDCYANALLAFCPDLGEKTALRGFSRTENFAIRDGAMFPADPSRPAWFEYRAATPYVIVESTLHVDCDPAALAGASLLLSKDDGTTWTRLPLDEATGRADVTPALVGEPEEPGAAYEELERNFGFVLHFELPASPEGGNARIDGVKVLTWSQVNPSLLPRLDLGPNEIEMTCREHGPGASAGLAWIEVGPRTDPERPFVAEPFTVNGEVSNGGEAPVGELVVSAYANGESGPVEMGSGRPAGPIDPGEERSFSVSCDPPDIEALYPTGPPCRLRTAVEIRREGDSSQPAAWGERTELDVDVRHKPDLVLVPGLTEVSPRAPSPGQEVEIRVLVGNFCPTRELLFLNGTSVASADVALFEPAGDSRRLIEQATLENLAPGGGALAVFRWTAPSAPGLKRLLLVADPDDLLDERDERNSITLDVNVVASPP